MKRPDPKDQLVISGLGILSAIGKSCATFLDSLLAGRHAFGYLQRKGRSFAGSESLFIGAELSEIDLPERFVESNLQSRSLSAQAAVTTLHEAWEDARLEQLEATRVGLIVGGSNVNQRELVNTHERFSGREQYLSPSYGVSFMDTDIVGTCSELFNVKGFAFTLGAASASGQLSILEACAAVQSGRVDACVALGALSDISKWELQSFRSLGAMGSDRFAEDPALASRPFDDERDGFIYGEACGAVVIESLEHALSRGANIHAKIIGRSQYMDGNRNPNPSLEGELRVIAQALESAGLRAEQIDYVNPHATGSTLGDTVEREAIRESGLKHAYVNTTKSITGHGLSASGAVEVVSTVLQLNSCTLHPSRNLLNPIDRELNWVLERKSGLDLRYALTLSMGFGGINSALCIERFS